jgi:peptidylprolyl isomerase
VLTRPHSRRYDLLVKIRISCFYLIIALLAGCGSGSDKSGDVVVWRNGRPVAIAGQGPPPKKLVVKDVEVGKGKLLTNGSTGVFRYRNFDYRTGQQYEDWWESPFETSFGKGESLDAWEKGLKGMRVGGRRELIVPAKETYGHTPEIYALELASVR